MIIIDDKIISQDILRSYFACNLKKCHGQCCVEGVCGAPLEEHEKQQIEEAFPIIKNSLTSLALQTINQQGKYLDLPEHGLVTPTIGSGEGICVYAIKNPIGIVKCAFEQAYEQQKIKFKKPISCHLFPIRITKTPINEALNYENIQICQSGCQLGNEKKTPLFVFLKDALVRKYGISFYNALQKIYKQYFN